MDSDGDMSPMTQPKFWSFHHPVFDKLSTFDSQTIPLLVARVQQNDRIAKEELFHQLLGYIKTRLGKILYREMRLRNEVDDLISFLSEWLLVVINNLETEKLSGENILGYVSTSLRGRCHDFLRGWLVFGPKFKCNKRQLIRQPLNSDTLYARENTHELLINLLDIAKTDLEREFIRLRSEGYRSVEIADILKLTPTDISRMRKALIRRFNATN
jgi:DNA-binding CsgD family transcriptional regulator